MRAIILPISWACVVRNSAPALDRLRAPCRDGSRYTGRQEQIVRLKSRHRVHGILLRKATRIFRSSSTLRIRSRELVSFCGFQVTDRDAVEAYLGAIHQAGGIIGKDA